jgi:glycosyltransferase involved in cell wall biosynthesis
MPKRVLVDTFCTANPEGTGIATYARVLTRTVHALDHTVTLLTGSRQRRWHSGSARKPMPPRAVLAFDHPGSEKSSVGPMTREDVPWWVRNPVFSIRTLAMKFGYPVGGMYPVSIDDTDVIEMKAVRDRLGYFDELVNVNDVFRASVRYFNATGRMLVVTPPAPVAVAHFTWNLPIRVRGAKNVYTIHDLIPLRLPHYTLENKDLYYRMVKHCVDTADVIATDSESSRRDIVTILDADESRVVNTGVATDIPEAVLARPPATTEALLQTFLGLAMRGYFLMVGSIEPRKNTARAIEAHIASGSPHPLVICGPRGALSAEELRHGHVLHHIGDPVPDGRANMQPRVMVLDYVPRDMLLTLIQGARALVFPSLYEGFGLPALEALVLGTPVIASQTSALPEVCGDAAVYIDPYDGASLCAAIRTVSRWREDEIAAAGQAGRAQARRFSAERYRDKIATLYGSLGCA